jgi:hypothetical protein
LEAVAGNVTGSSTSSADDVLVADVVVAVIVVVALETTGSTGIVAVDGSRGFLRAFTGKVALVAAAEAVGLSTISSLSGDFLRAFLGQMLGTLASEAGFGGSGLSAFLAVVTGLFAVVAIDVVDDK